MGCGPQVIKTKNLESSAQMKKDMPSRFSSRIKPTSSVRVNQETWYESSRKPSKNLSSINSYQNVSFLKLESVMTQKNKRNA